MDWLNILIFGVIPVLTVVIVFLVKRKMLWASPIISTVLALVTYIITIEPTMTEIFCNNEWRGFFLLAMFMHFGIAVVLTAITYFAAYIHKRKKFQF